MVITNLSEKPARQEQTVDSLDVKISGSVLKGNKGDILC